jgi:hypothetical protein
MAKKRNYRKEYDEYHAKPEQKKRRAERNNARRKAAKAGKVRKGDNKEVHHQGASRTGSLKRFAVRVLDRITNRKIQPDRPGGKKKKKK